MNKKLKVVITRIIILIVIVTAAYFYGYSKTEGIWLWNLERAVVFAMGLLYLVGFANILMRMFKR